MKLLATMSLAYVMLVASLYWFQRGLQYFPDVALVHPGDVGLDGFSTVNLTAEDGTGLVAWYAPPAGRKPAIVYFQGNAQGIAARWQRFKLFNDHGYGVLAVGYRGYSGSQGTPSEHGLLQDGRAALAFLKQKGIEAARTVLYGESLGSGIATQLAAADDTRPGAVILEAPFTAASHVAGRHYWYVPVSLLMKDQFRSIDHAPDIGAPVFVMHGDADPVVPIDHGRSLFAAITSPKEFLNIPGGGHIDDLTMHIWQRMEGFIKKHLPH